MSLPNITVNNQDNLQSEVTSIENYFLYIGKSTANQNEIIPINAKSDLDTLLGADDSPLKTQVKAAKSNANTDWAALVATLGDDDTWQSALDVAMRKNYSVEAVVICDPVTTSDQLITMHTVATNILNTYERRVFLMACYAGIDDTNQTWFDYTDQARTLTDTITAERVLVVPLLWPNLLGVLAGRLANSKVKVADSPMRVKTGALVDVGELPSDKDGQLLDLATLTTLDKARFSVPVWFADYDGIYWADGNMLTAANSDFKFIERLRVVDKAARLLRPVMIADVADRTVNATAASLARAKARYIKVLRQMAQPTTMNGEQIPGEIQAPNDNSVAVQFVSYSKMVLNFSVQPYNFAKDLEGNIALDLSIEELA